MNEFLNRIFGLSSMGFGDPDVQFGFARPIPAWGWMVAVVGAFALAWWSYWRLSGGKRVRVVLAGLRGLTLLAILMIISGPQLVKPNERIEKDWVLVLVDRSASMNIGDEERGGGAREPRDAALKAALARAWPSLSELGHERTVVWMGFDSGVYDLRAREFGVDAGAATGRRTAIGAAIDQALARAAARPISGVVVMSDGRSADEVSRAALKRLQSEQIPVITVALGSSEPVADLSVHRADAPSMAFINDTVPVSVEVDRVGAGSTTSRGRVELIDKATGEVLDQQPLPEDNAAWPDGRARLTLVSKPSTPGKMSWTVRIVPETPDLIAENNGAEVGVELVDRPLRVAYFDGYPRWEYRYLKNLLLREKSMQCAATLLAANRQYTQEGEIVLDAVPRSPEDWAKFDVIVLGDLPASMFSREQLENLRDHVAIRGAGLLWVGGPGSTPGSWRDSALADLLPFQMPRADVGVEVAGVKPFSEPVLMYPAPAAARLRLLEMGDTPAEPWPAMLSDPRTGWAGLRYAQRIDPSIVKPTAEVLALAAPVSEADGSGHVPEFATPVVLSMRYGAGRVMYVATDEIWRWRFARGEALPERFWLPLLRLQGRESLARSARPAVLEVSPRRPEVEQPVRVAVQLVDQALVDAAPARMTARARRIGTDAAADLTLTPESAGPKGSGRAFSSTWTPTEPGKYRVEVLDASVSGLGLVAEVEVALPDDEMRRPEADHAMLAKLSADTAGQVLPLSRLEDLVKPGMLPKRELHIAGMPDVTTLWDKPVVLALVLALLVLEWIGRRVVRLA